MLVSALHESAHGTKRRFAAVRRFGRDRSEADMPRASGAGRSDENDPGCVKTLRGITAPGILGPLVMRRAKKRKNLSSARHYDQIRLRFHTTKTHLRHWRPEFLQCKPPVSST